jgi:hypothetical protein
MGARNGSSSWLTKDVDYIRYAALLLLLFNCAVAALLHLFACHSPPSHPRR